MNVIGDYAKNNDNEWNNELRLTLCGVLMYFFTHEPYLLNPLSVI